MKRILSVLIISVLLLVSGCKALPQAEAPGESQYENEPREITEQEQSTITDFAIELLKKTHGESGTVISPVSILYALGILENGADSETLTEINDTVGLDTNALNNFLLQYKSGLKDTDKTFVKLANSVWANKDEIEVKKEFSDRVRSLYDAQIKNVSFSDDTKDEINYWVSESTGGKIDGALDYISPDAIMYIINAVSFDGKWEKPYNASGTKIRLFTKEDGSQINISMMTGSENQFILGETEKGFVKSYEGGNYSFIAIMPNEGISMAQYLDTLTGEKLRGLIENKTETEGIVTIPKFRTESHIELNDTLKDMGIKSAFNINKADFSQISDEKTFINRFLHRAYINVDEDGTQAGGATIVEGSNSSSADFEQIVFDRPFIYMIADTKSGQPLFLGTYVGEDLSPTPQREILFTCGNTETKLYIGDGINEEQKVYEFMGGDSVYLSQLLADLEYSPDKVCKCLPKYRVDTEYKTGYGIDLGETPYARCDEGQADLTAEQAERIEQIIENVKSGKVF